MPTYEYRCHDCENVFDHYQSFSDDSVPKCPGKYKDGPYKCTKPRKGKVSKVFGSVGISFKGSGFYKNDHGSKPKSSGSTDAGSSSTGSSTASSDSSSKKSDTKTSDSTSKKSDTSSSTSSTSSSD